MPGPNKSRMAFAPLLFVAALVPASAQTFEPPPAKEGFSYPELYCTNRGHRVEMGEASCLRVDDEVFLARCGMSLNSPAWRRIQDGCPAEFDRVSAAEPAAE